MLQLACYKALGMAAHLSKPLFLLEKWENNNVNMEHNQFSRAAAVMPGS